MTSDRSYHEMERELARRIRRELARDTGLSDADDDILRALADTPDGVLRARELRCAVRWEKSRLTDAGREAIVAACCQHAKAVRA